MKRLYLFTFVLAGVLLVSLPGFGLEWTIETVDTLRSWCWVSIALDPSVQGWPHVSYYDGFDGDLKHAVRTDTGWCRIRADEEDDVGQYCSLALRRPPEDTTINIIYAHVSYYDATNRDLRYVRFDPCDLPGWVSVVDSTGDVGWCTSIALDDSGYPHISYIDNTNDDLKYAYFDGTNWVVTVVDNGNIQPSELKSTSIALKSDDCYPSISYQKRLSQGGALMYASFNGSSWEYDTVDAPTGAQEEVGRWSSLALDQLDRPHISYWKLWPSSIRDSLRYAVKYNNQWHIQTLAPGGSFSNSIAVGRWDGYPRIAFGDYSLLGAVAYAYWNGLDWEFDTIVRSGQAFAQSLALDTLDNPHMSWNDLVNSHLKHAWGAPTDRMSQGAGSRQAVAAGFSNVCDLSQSSPNPFVHMTDIGYHVRDARSRASTTLIIYDLTGRSVRTLVDGQISPGHHRAVWDGRDACGRKVPAGTYFYRLNVGGFTATRKMTRLR